MFTPIPRVHPPARLSGQAVRGSTVWVGVWKHLLVKPTERFRHPHLDGMWRAAARLNVASPRGRTLSRFWRHYCLVGTGAGTALALGHADSSDYVAHADSSDYEAAMRTLDAHFGGHSAGAGGTKQIPSGVDDNPWARNRGDRPASSSSSSSPSRGERRVLRIGFLQCEELKDYLSPQLFDTYGGYYKMNCSAC